MVDADELQQLAVDIAREAGALARRRRDEGVRIAATKSALADIVTEADREVEQLIRDRLAQARPDDGFLGEESGAERGTSGVTWVVDPIDGTVNYAYGIPLRRLDRRRQRRADAGGVDRRDRRRVRPGRRALPRDPRRGAWLGSQRLAVSTVADAGALLATGFGYDPATHAGDLERVRRVMPLARDLRRAARPRSTWRSSPRADWTATSSADSGRGITRRSAARHRGGGVVTGAPVRPARREMTIAANADLAARLSSAIYR
jgi:myo-inositol-1(or 4)-monophosphatase